LGGDSKKTRHRGREDLLTITNPETKQGRYRGGAE